MDFQLNNLEATSFLIVGCGSIGRRHLRNLKSLGISKIMALDVQPERAGAAAEELGISTFTNLSQALESSPDVVFITTPTSFHVPLALDAANHDCHIFIEKPLSHNLDGVDELISLVQAKELVTLVGCNMRFHPGLALVKRLLEDGAVGRVLAARVQVGQWLPDWHPWEDYRHGYSARKDLGGGVILDAIHELDYIGWLLGSPVHQVVCFAGNTSSLEIDTEDTAAIILRFADGIIGEVHMDYVQRAYSRSCHIIGDMGTILWDYTEGQVRLYSASEESWHTYCNPTGWEPNQMYIDEMCHFLRCLSGEEEPVLNVTEGKRVLKLALAAKQSADIGEVVVMGENPR